MGVGVSVGVGVGVVFTSPRGTNSRETHYLLSYVFGLSTLIGNTQSFRCGPFEAEYQRGTKTTFFNPYKV